MTQGWIPVGLVIAFILICVVLAILTDTLFSH